MSKNNKNDCLHIFTNVARRRGNKFRLQCDDCTKMLPWTPADDSAYAINQDTMVRIETEPDIPDLRAEIEGAVKNANVSVMESDLKNYYSIDKTELYESMKVSELRATAKERGLSNYSSAKKADLINMLVDSDTQVVR